MNNYHNMTPQELEREAYRTQNALALEIIRRLESALNDLVQQGQVITHYKDGTFSGKTV